MHLIDSDIPQSAKENNKGDISTMCLIIDDAQAQSAVSMTETIAAMRDVYRGFSAGEIEEAPRANVIFPRGFLRVMVAAWPQRKLGGYKVLHRANGSAGISYHLYELETARLLAIMDATYITAVRTGACGGLAADLLAAPDADTLAVIGTGKEARAQVEAICAVRNIRHIKAFGRDPARREEFCREMADRFGVEASSMSNGRSTLDGAQIIAVATNTGSTGPAFFGDWIGDQPVHINSIGSTLPNQREIDEHVWKNVDRIIIDAEVLLEESGDAIKARSCGTLDETKIALLGDVVTGKAIGRGAPSQRTLYKSVGSALQDLATAAMIYEKVRDRGLPCPTMPSFQKMLVMQD